MRHLRLFENKEYESGIGFPDNPPLGEIVEIKYHKIAFGDDIHIVEADGVLDNYDVIRYQYYVKTGIEKARYLYNHIGPDDMQYFNVSIGFLVKSLPKFIQPHLAELKKALVAEYPYYFSNKLKRDNEKIGLHEGRKFRIEKLPPLKNNSIEVMKTSISKSSECLKVSGKLTNGDRLDYVFLLTPIFVYDENEGRNVIQPIGTELLRYYERVVNVDGTYQYDIIGEDASKNLKGDYLKMFDEMRKDAMRHFPVYYSKKLLDVNGKTGIFEKLSLFGFNDVHKTEDSNYFIVRGVIDANQCLKYGFNLKDRKEFLEFHRDSQDESSNDTDVCYFYNGYGDEKWTIAGWSYDEPWVLDKYEKSWFDLREYAKEKYPMYFSEKIMSSNVKTGIFEMKHLKTFENYEEIDYNKLAKTFFTEVTPMTGNSECYILQGQIDDDLHITYGVYINGSRVGEEFMEYYRGENYNTKSMAVSSSRHYTSDKIPTKWRLEWETLRELAKKEHPYYYSEKLFKTNDKTGIFEV